jgi:hypothetical protein
MGSTAGPPSHPRIQFEDSSFEKLKLPSCWVLDLPRFLALQGCASLASYSSHAAIVLIWEVLFVIFASRSLCYYPPWTILNVPWYQRVVLRMNTYQSRTNIASFSHGASQACRSTVFLRRSCFGNLFPSSRSLKNCNDPLVEPRNTEKSRLQIEVTS